MAEQNDVDLDTEIVTKPRVPPRYKVIILNDDVTPVDWVVAILKRIFHHDEKTAQDITTHIHNQGSGVAGIYTYEIAEQKVMEATTASRQQGYPLKITLEEE